MSTEIYSNDLSAFTDIVTALKRLDEDQRNRVFQSVAAFLGLEITGSANSHSPSQPTPRDYFSPTAGTFSEDRSISAKEFMRQKQPKTDVERVACLAYYLTHYKDTPHFKTLDLSVLNTDAAQPKFSNAAFSVKNATNLGYLVPATKGYKQLSAPAEHFVEALPDRNAAREAMATARPRRKTKNLGERKADKKPLKT